VDEPTLAVVLVLIHGWTLALCMWAWARERSEKKGASRPWVWALLALAVAVLGFHHATDAGAQFTEWFRRMALQEGWYGERRVLQRELVLAVPIAAFLAGGVLLALVRQQWRRYLPAVLALIFIAGLSAVQLISLHGVDAVMGRSFFGVPLSRWLNLLGVSLVGIAVLWSERYRAPSGTAARKPAKGKR
jgi:hypothetical protein